MFVAFILMLGFAIAANAQFRAAIQGGVTDPQGAAIVGAVITLTSKETSKADQTRSGDEGIYRFDRLAPGHYSITVEAAGFKKKILEDVVVSAEQTQGINIQLEAGDVTAVVTVSEQVGETLHTENANVGGAISTREIQRLPQVGRDPYELLRLTPGIFGLGARSGTGDSVGLPNNQGPGGSNSQIFQTENQVPITAGGQRVENNNFQVDGVNAMSQAWGGAAVVTPNQESVKEVQVLANNYSAEFGRNTGAQILVVSQNGTDKYHGSLFFKRNTPGMNSFQDFVRSGTAIREDPQRVNRFLSQYGGSVGGPIIKKRLFFFFSYETVRQSASRIETQWVETPQFVSTIQAVRGSSNAAKILAFEGAPRVASVQNVTCAFAGFTDPTKCQAVAGGLDIGSPTGAIGQTVPGVGGGLDGIPDIEFANLTIPSKSKNEQYNARVDYQLTEDDLVAFSMYFVPVKNDFNDSWGNRGRSNLDFNSTRRNTVGTLLWTRTFSPTLINEARFNVTRWYFDEVQSNPNIGWGLPRDHVFFEQAINFGNQVGPGVFFQTAYNFRDVVSKVHNAHALKFGVDIIKEQNNDTAPWAGRPEFNFGNLWNFANDAPDSESAFFDPKTGAFTDLAAYLRSSYYGVFAQDDWKIRPNLTLNLGLRYEYFAPLRSKRDRIANLLLGPGGSLLGASIKTGGNLYEPDRNNFAPQIGFAWSPERFNNKAVLRGGFGVSYNRLPGNRTWESRFNPPFFAGFFLTGSDILYGLASDPNGFNYPANPAAKLTFDPSTGIPTSGPKVNISAILQDAPNSYALRYSIGAEYEVGKGWVASLAYQGSNARKLPRLVPYHLFVTPNPRINNVNLLLTDAYSNFNGMLAGAQHRFAKGFLFNAEYRWSRSKDTCSHDACSQTYPFDQSTEYGPSDFDVTHSFRGFGVWNLPLFRNRNDWVGKLAGGWELSGILTASSGFPWTPVVGGSACSVAVAGGGVCPLRPIAQIKSPATTDTINGTFLGEGQFPGGGLLYFTPPPAGSFTTPPRPGVGRNSFRGPRYFATDLTILKRFGLPSMPVLGEAAGFEIRYNVYNLFNTVNLQPFSANDDNTQIQNVNFGRALHVLSGRTSEIQLRFNF